MQNKMHFKVIAIAGTFDRLHKGHRYFISEAFKLGERVIIGLTSNEYATKKTKRLRYLGGSRMDSPEVEEFVKRNEELNNFLKQEKLIDRTEIVKIDNVYGPAITNSQIEALVVTEDTHDGGLAVNKKREELGLPPLKLLTIPMVLAQDKRRIASTRIRLGEIDRWGKLFVSRIKYHVSSIREELRQELKKPLGKLIKGDPENLNYIAVELKEVVGKTNFTMISTVGDEVTKLCNEVGIPINLAIIDYKVNRKEKYHSLSELGFLNSKALKEESVIRITNPPGHITNELVSAVKNAYLGIIKDGKQRVIQVEGEEDLAGVPAILLAPLGSLVLYGQPAFVPNTELWRGKPESGVVVVEATEEKKSGLLRILKL